MIHTSRTVTVGKMESIINEPIVLYRGDREVEVEFAIVGSKFTFSKGGNVIKSTNATHGQLVVDTPTGENMFSEVTECHEGKVVFTITKEMIDELAEVGLYSFQIRLFDESQVSRVTIPPVYQGIEIRHPMAAEDETDLVDVGLVDYSVVRKDDFENVATFLPNGDYNKTDWEQHDVISRDRLNKVEDAIYEINKSTEGLYPTFQEQYDTFSDGVKKDVKAYKEEMEDEVEQFERDISQQWGEFKVDYKDEVHERLDEVEGELEGLHAKDEELSEQLGYIENKINEILIYNNMPKEEIQSLLDNGGNIVFTKGVYDVVLQGGIGYTISSNTDIKFDTGAVLQLITQNTSSYNILKVSGENIYIENPQIIGDTSTTTCTLGEWGHGICVMESENVLIRGGYVKECFGDGIYVGGSNKKSSNIYIENITSDSNRRQGLSITNAHDVWVMGSTFSNTGGTLPEAGIDIEPNPDDEVSYNIFIDKCILKNNAGSGIDVFCSVNAKITNCNFDGNSYGININGGENRECSAIVDNCTIINTQESTISINDYTDTVIQNCKLNSGKKSCFRPFEDGTRKQLTIKNNIINMNTGKLFIWSKGETVSNWIFSHNVVIHSGDSTHCNIYGNFKSFDSNLFVVDGISDTVTSKTNLLHFSLPTIGNYNRFINNTQTLLYINNIKGINYGGEYLAVKSLFASELKSDTIKSIFIDQYVTETTPTSFSVGETITLINGDKNVPTAEGQGILKTIRPSNATAYNKFIVQFFYPANNSSDASNNMYIRKSNSGGTWGEWTKYTPSAE